jgi:hypothetical protein
VVLAVVVRGSDDALKLVLNRFSPEPDTGTGTVLDVEEIFVPEGALSMGHGPRLAITRVARRRRVQPT